MIDFKKKYLLEDEIVRFRPLNSDDYINLVEYSVNESEIWKYSMHGADGHDNLKLYLNTAIQGRKNEKEYPFIVFDKRQIKYVGSTRFSDIQLKNETLQLGYTWYGKKFQGTGLNKHCKYLLLKFAFEDLDIQRIEFRQILKMKGVSTQ